MRELAFDEEGNMQYPSFPEDSKEKDVEGGEAQEEQVSDSRDRYLLFKQEERKKTPQKKSAAK
jgi:hypothetical protein